MASQPEEFDVIVVGGGPGGSTAASLTAKAGAKVLLLERETFPRYQIGESLLPSTVHGICNLLGVGDEIAAAGFMKKQGGTFKWGTSPEPWTFAFAVSPRMAGPTSHAYQVERRRFDQILLENTRRLGVDVRENCAVTEVLADDERVRGVRFTQDGESRTAHARFLVDASGNKGSLHGSVGGQREYSPFFRNLALFGYFEGGKRLPAPNSGNILCVAFDAGWFWYIPLSDSLTSVGAVVRREMAHKVQGDQERALHDLIAECPLIADYLSDATRVTEGDYGQVRVRKDYSYCNTSFWRPGMCLVGDAACFIDPVFSSGVHLATYSALLAARSINSVLAGAVNEERAFTEFEQRYRREYAVFHDFLVSFYDLHVDENSYFWQARKVTRSSAPDMQSFIELVGGVASGEDALAGSTDLIRRQGANTAELGAAVNAISPGGSGFLGRSSLVADAMFEGSQIQAGVLFGEDAPQEPPLFEGGLATAGNGLMWTEPKN
ncbi:tryptophan 7-halogenase [Micromonospora chersina]|uniref:tryptophan 7-halogenase n=1 Tax=Micromonospora chersina TaxID=47854 RepID=UPI003714838A